MRNSTIGWCITIFVLLLVLLQSCNSKEQKIITTPKIELGSVKCGDTTQFNIECINNGSSNIVLTRIYVLCSCIRSVDNLKKVVPSRSKTTYTFEYKIEGIGYVEKHIYLYFNDSKTPYITTISSFVELK